MMDEEDEEKENVAGKDGQGAGRVSFKQSE